MADDDQAEREGAYRKFEREFSAARSHQDAKSGNDQTQSMYQWLFALNSASASAILAYVTASNALYRFKYPNSLFLAISLLALGAFSGVAAMRGATTVLYEWHYYWALRSGIWEKDGEFDPDKMLSTIWNKAIAAEKRRDRWFYCSIALFFIGGMSFAFGLLTFDGRPSATFGD